MAERLADIVAQIQNVRQLGAVVTAMRGIAASRAQRGRSQLAGIDAYTEVVSRAIGHALGLLPADGVSVPSIRAGKAGFVLFCAEQGFAGAFSERVLDTAMANRAGGAVLIVGTHGLTVAEERGLTPIWSASMATHVDAISSLANRLADELYEMIAAGAVSTVDIVFSRSVSGSGIRIDRHSLLPLDFGRFAMPGGTREPLTTLRPRVLLERLAVEYVYAQLCEAAMHAFVAENDARTIAMTSAKTNIDAKLSSLSQRERQLRQEEITSEIIELAAGAAALRSA
ncbi:ATPase [Mycobacterium sp. KBS0706]|uniref:F0F1 ATP synthase subunit gamma n=1 Tax=Mycobacterium sp. KBS0706 TaxID=2578109 RepID=UPI00110FA1CB|nr:FoF1 ATP synthase subunit gamma [Mycobacterium sp. KBS0706]TSD85759.1 ATPase [Mycobacterium sp. KBS0706]